LAGGEASRRRLIGDGTRRGLLNFRPPILLGGAVRMIGLAVVLALSLILVPLAADAQPRARIPQLGYLVLALSANRPRRSAPPSSPVSASWAGSMGRPSPSSTAPRNGMSSCSTTSPRSWSG